MLYDGLPVFADVYSLTKLVFVCTQDFPREHKYTLGQDMKRDCLLLLRTIYRANKSRDRHAVLDGFLDDFELLKLEVRLSADLKLLSLKKQAELARLTDSVGRQITGWRNASSNASISTVTAVESEQ